LRGGWRPLSLSHALLGESKKDWITLRYDYENMKGLVEKS